VVPRSLKGACNGAVGTGRTARNGASTRPWPTGFTSCRGGGRMAWSARVPAPHGLGRRAIGLLSRRTIFPFEECIDASRVTHASGGAHRLPCKFPPCGLHLHASWCPEGA